MKLLLTTNMFKQIRFSSTNQQLVYPPLAQFVRDLINRRLVIQSHPMFPYKEQDMTSYVSTFPNMVYAGFDPTSDSFHVGNLLILTALVRSSIFGCTPITLIGEATAAVGDPSGHKYDRNVLSREVLRENAKSLIAQIETVFANAQSLQGTSLQFRVLNNMDWYKEMKMLDFLASSKRFRMSEMLRTGPVKSRLADELSLSYAEFSYQILQANDWYHLSKEHNCYCQLGGSDQLGNLKAGYEDIHARTDRRSLAICVPLLTDEGGKKLGKSSAGMVGKSCWLDPKRTSPFAFYQYYRQLHDDVAEETLIRFSLKPLEEVVDNVLKHRESPGKWIAQTLLADELTALVHGEQGHQLALKCSDVLFNGSMKELEELSPETIKELFGEASTFKIPRNSLMTFGELAEATRPGGAQLMITGALKINGRKVLDPDQKLLPEQILINSQFSLVCWGKRKFSLILWI